MGSITAYYYWIGVQRAALGSDYLLMDGSSLPQAPSQQPYSHWSWYHPAANGTANYDCVLAQRAHTYDMFIGDPSDPAHLADISMYSMGTSDDR
jgi:hypothetical protein